MSKGEGRQLSLEGRLDQGWPCRPGKYFVLCPKRTGVTLENLSIDYMIRQHFDAIGVSVINYNCRLIIN